MIRWEFSGCKRGVEDKLALTETFLLMKPEGLKGNEKGVTLPLYDETKYHYSGTAGGMDTPGKSLQDFWQKHLWY